MKKSDEDSFLEKDLKPYKALAHYEMDFLYNVPIALFEKFTYGVRHSETYKCPVYIYRNIQGEIQFIDYTYQSPIRQLTQDQTAYFQLEPILLHDLVTKVLFFKDPIELLSYINLRNPDRQRVLCLSVHHLSDLSELHYLKEYFPNARFFSYVPNNTISNILYNTKITLCIDDKIHTMRVDDGKVYLKYDNTEIDITTNEVTKALLPKFRSKHKRTILFKAPRKPFKTFNQILKQTTNDT